MKAWSDQLLAMNWLVETVLLVGLFAGCRRVAFCTGFYAIYGLADACADQTKKRENKKKKHKCMSLRISYMKKESGGYFYVGNFNRSAVGGADECAGGI